MEEAAGAPTGTIGASVDQLDLATVTSVCQTLASEIVLDKLIDTLMRTAIEHAGAERALLMLSRGVEQRIAAEARTDGDTVSVHLCDELATGSIIEGAGGYKRGKQLMDGYWERHLKPWDTGAGALIVAEAGGIVTDWVGGRFDVHEGAVVASNGAIHEELIAELGRVHRPAT
jgi:3'-phosphoadenosine 5'-phosphosulfate (PAPS) 3'-phosphatase